MVVAMQSTVDTHIGPIQQIACAVCIQCMVHPSIYQVSQQNPALNSPLLNFKPIYYFFPCKAANSSRHIRIEKNWVLPPPTGLMYWTFFFLNQQSESDVSSRCSTRTCTWPKNLYPNVLTLQASSEYYLTISPINSKISIALFVLPI